MGEKIRVLAVPFGAEYDSLEHRIDTDYARAFYPEIGDCRSHSNCFMYPLEKLLPDQETLLRERGARGLLMTNTVVTYILRGILACVAFLLVVSLLALVFQPR